MPALSDLITPETVQKLAIPSNYKLGEEIAKDGTVDFLELKPKKLKAKVFSGKTSSRTVEMKAMAKGLVYKCTCSNKPDWFCKHCVAVGLAFLEK